MKAPERLRLSSRLLRQVRPYRLQIAGILALSFLAPPMALMTPLPLKIAVDSVLGAHPLPGFLDRMLPGTIPRSAGAMLIFAAALTLLVAALTQLRDFAASILAASTSERLLRDFRAQLFRHVQRLSLAYHDRRGTADSVYRIQYDATSLGNIAVDGVVPFISSALTLAAMLVVTSRVSPKLAAVAMAICPLLLAVSAIYRGRLRSQAHEIRRLESSTLSVVNEALGAARVVKGFAQEAREEERFVRQSMGTMRARIRLAFSEGGFGAAVALIAAGGTAAVLFIGTREVQDGAMTLGELLLVMGYLGQIYTPLKTLGKKSATMQGHLAGAERAFALLDEAADVPERPGARRLVRAAGDVEFRHVSFGYGDERTVLSDLSFRVARGTRVGLSGATGAGKTTLVSLLTRFYDPTDGAILLDGEDLRDYRIADLRNQFAIVIQEPVLFSTSIAENIAYARPGAAELEIVEAAKAAHAHEFICRLPRGYGTLVGERGMCLSGGERQRVSLARAFLKDAPILILDEPTSSVDFETERAILGAMEALMIGRTTFIITHRAAMLDHCDLVHRIDGGRLVERAPAGLATGARGGVS
ncbi:MAG TPA: ABC transporter ATP-binding protein [Verrucomicrobiae bacterium]|nr:ABC transporter ATP-binding protein [Verrucomicrobiae bacterium]